MGAGCGIDEDLSPRNPPQTGKPNYQQQISPSEQFMRISDRFSTVEQLQAGLRTVGLESSNRMFFLSVIKILSYLTLQ